MSETIIIKEFSSTREMMAFCADDEKVTALRKEAREKYGPNTGNLNMEELNISITLKATE